MKAILRHWLPEEARSRQAFWQAGLIVALTLAAVLIVLLLTRDWPGAAEKVIAKGRTPRIEVVALAYVWKALLLDAALLAGLIVTLPWWARPPRRLGQSERSAENKAGAPRWLVVAGSVAVLMFALWLRAPRLTLSLYNDEAHNYARLWSGIWEHKTGEPVLREARWGETWFLNNAGNNSQPFSLVARLCLETACAAGWSVKGEVTEWAVRLPSLVAGLLSIWLMGLLARRHFGFPGMMLVMLALALHPWHQRYSTEARGYALMLLGVVVMLYFLDRAFGSQRWRHWLGFAAGLFLCATAFLGSIYFLICLNAAVLLHQARRWRQTGDASLVTRPLVAGLAAAMAGLPLLLPLIPQLLKVLETHHSIHGVMGANWWRDVAGYLIAGARWGDADPGNPVNQALSRWITQPLWLAAFGLWLLSLAAGMAVFWRRGGLLRLQLLVTPAALLLSWFLMSRKGQFLNHWYVLYAVPWLVLALGVGALWWWRRSRLAGAAVLLGALLVPGRVALAYRHLEKQNERGPVLTALGAAFPQPGKTTPRPLLGAFWCNSNLYHPEVVPLVDEAALENLIEQARRAARPLFVCHSHRALALRHSAGLMRLLEESGQFEKVREFYGQEEQQNTLHLFRLRP